MIRSLLTMIWQFSPVSFIILLRYFNGPGEIKGWVYRGGGGGEGRRLQYLNFRTFKRPCNSVTVYIYVIVTMKWPYINLKNTSLYKLIHFILSKYFKFEGKSCYSHWELSCTQGNWILRIRFFFFGGGTEEKILQFSSFTFVHLQRTQLIVYQTVWHLFDMETDFALQLDLIEDGSEWWS